MITEIADELTSIAGGILLLLVAHNSKSTNITREPNLARLTNLFPDISSAYAQSGKKLGSFTPLNSQITAMYVSRYPGKPRANDTSENRLQWLTEALESLVQDGAIYLLDYGNITVDLGYDYRSFKEKLPDKADFKIYGAPPPSAIILPSFDLPVVEKIDVKEAERRCQTNCTYTLDDFYYGQTFAPFLDNGAGVPSPAPAPSLVPSQSLWNQPLHPSWAWLASDQTLIKLSKKYGLQELIDDSHSLPGASNVLRAFNSCPFNEIKVVILGQDPYPNRKNAHGLSFSVPKGVAIPASLRNIYTALKNDLGDDFKVPSHGNLESWTRQGVLLLNTALTVTEGKPLSHADKWHEFTDHIIKQISLRRENVVFMLWGQAAKSKSVLIDINKHLVLEHRHPSPQAALKIPPEYTFSASCRHFSRANAYLKEHQLQTVDWSI